MTQSTTTLRATFISESAAYRSTFGWYNRVTGRGGILFADVEAEGDHPVLVAGQSYADFTVNTADLPDIQFFLVSNGAILNRNDADDLTGAIQVVRLSNGAYAIADVDSHGNTRSSDLLAGAGANALFTETSKNAGGVDYASSVVGSRQTASTLTGDTADGATGLIAWEDLAATRNRNGTYSQPGDADYNDAVFRISVVSANALPVAVADAASLSEDAAATTINVLGNDTDPNPGDTLTITAVNGGSAAGTVSIAPDGKSIRYTPSPAFQALAAGETAQETISYTVSDQAGASSTATVTITIVGQNDAPTAVTLTGVDIAENAAGAVIGVLSTADPDHNDQFTYTVTDPRFEIVGSTLKLKAGQALDYEAGGSIPITVTATDAGGLSKSATFTIQVGNVNEAPAAAGDTAAGSEDTALVILAQSLLGNDTDPDAGDTRTLVSVQGAVHGSVALDGDGNVVFMPEANYSGPASFSYTMRDAAGLTSTATVAITIAPVGDAAVIGDPSVRDVTEDVAVNGAGQLTASGVIPIADADDGEAAFRTIAVGAAGNLGTLVLAADGSYTYAVDNAAVQYLGEGATRVDSFTVTALDGTERIVTFTIHGSNDAPTVVADATAPGTIVEAGIVPPGNTPFAGNASAAGSVLANDDDADGDGLIVVGVAAGTQAFAAGQVGASVTGQYGRLVLGADGAWTYQLDNSFAATNALAAGASASDVFTYTVSDGHGGTATTTLSIAITGTNDRPTSSGGPSSGGVTEDIGFLRVASGQLTSSDPDQGATAAWTIDGARAPAPASYHFSMDNLRLTRIGGGLIIEDTFSDGNPPPSSPPFSDGTPTTYGGAGGFTEAGGRLILDSAAAVVSGAGDPFVSQNAVVRTNIDPSNTTNGLKLTNSFVVTGVFDLILPDSNREEFGIRLTDRLTGGTGVPPDQPGNNVVGLVVRQGTDGVDYIMLRNNNNVTGVNTILAQIPLDAPAGADQIQLRLQHSTNATVVTAAFDYLQGGAVIGSQFFSVTPSIFNGENWIRAEVIGDAPATQDQHLDGVYGTLHLTQAGFWSYVLDNSRPVTQGLITGQTVTETFTVRVTDQYGGFATRTITVNVVGTGDAPVIGNPTVTDVTEDSNVDQNGYLTASGAIPIFDADAGQSGFSTDAPSALTPLGSLALSQDGSYAYSVSNNAVQFLGEGETYTDPFLLTTLDGTPSDIGFTIHGVNDTPVARGDAGAVQEAGYGVPGIPGASGWVLDNDSDADWHDTLTVIGAAGSAGSAPVVDGAETSIAGQYGTLRIGSDGHWFYDLDNSSPATQALAEGQTVTEVFTYTVSDPNGATSDASISVDVTGTNDAPEPARISVHVTEGTGVQQIDLLAGATDAEVDPIHVTVAQDLPAVSLDPTGRYLLVDTDSDFYNGLRQGAVATFGVRYEIADSHGAATQSIAEIFLDGSNDAPIVWAAGPSNILIEPGEHPHIAVPGIVDSYAFMQVVEYDGGDTVTLDLVDHNGAGALTLGGAYGSVTLDGTTLHYHLDASDPDTIALKSGDVRYETFTVRASDGIDAATTDVTFEVHGRSDFYDGGEVGYTYYWPTSGFPFTMGNFFAALGGGGTILPFTDTFLPGEGVEGRAIAVERVGGEPVPVNNAYVFGMEIGDIDVARDQLIITFDQGWTFDSGFTDTISMRDGSRYFRAPTQADYDSGELLTWNHFPGAPGNTYTFSLNDLPPIDIVAFDAASHGGSFLGEERMPGLHWDAHSISLDLFPGLHYSPGGQIVLNVTFHA